MHFVVILKYLLFACSSTEIKLNFACKAQTFKHLSRIILFRDIIGEMQSHFECCKIIFMRNFATIFRDDFRLRTSKDVW